MVTAAPDYARRWQSFTDMLRLWHGTFQLLTPARMREAEVDVVARAIKVMLATLWGDDPPAIGPGARLDLDRTTMLMLCRLSEMVLQIEQGALDRNLTDAAPVAFQLAGVEHEWAGSFGLRQIELEREALAAEDD